MPDWIIEKKSDQYSARLNTGWPGAENQGEKHSRFPTLGVQMRLSTHGARRATATAMATSLAAVGLFSAACTPASTANKVISGTIQGADGKIVDVLMGFDVINAAGQKIDLGGSRVGYSQIQRHNHCVPTSGASVSVHCTFMGKTTQVTGYTWAISVPASATRVYIEVYPKAPTPTAWLDNYRGYTGPSAGTTNTSTYSTVYKQSIPVPGNVSNVSIVLPKVCGAPGGTTGTLAGHINGWNYGYTGKANAWSMAGSGSSQGFATGTVDSSGNYRITGLQSGQRYGIQASGGGRSWNMVNLTLSRSNATFISNACQTKVFNF